MFILSLVFSFHAAVEPFLGEIDICFLLETAQIFSPSSTSSIRRTSRTRSPFGSCTCTRPPRPATRPLPLPTTAPLPRTLPRGLPLPLPLPPLPLPLPPLLRHHLPPLRRRPRRPTSTLPLCTVWRPCSCTAGASPPPRSTRCCRRAAVTRPRWSRAAARRSTKRAPPRPPSTRSRWPAMAVRLPRSES